MPPSAQELLLILKARDDASKVIHGVGGTLQQFGEQAVKLGSKLTLGITTPLALIGRQAITVAGDFEAAMNVLSISARSSGTALEELNRAAIRVGADTELIGIDAMQAADAMTNFYKAGLTTADIFGGEGGLNSYLEEGASLTGALRAAVDLAAASELDLGQASDVVAIAMATFGLQAEEATRITDAFVRAADASVTSVPELTEALSAVGPTAAAFGWTLEDLNTALAILSERGIRGSEAGTNLKSMMTNLMRPTDDVAATLQELGVALYDSNGQMVDLRSIISQLEQSMAGMTEEQRNMAVQTLAGTYGMKAMQTLLAEGAAGWDAMTAAVESAASTQEVAAARTQGFSAAMEQLHGAVQTFLIQAATPLMSRFVTPFIQQITAILGKAIDLDPKIIALGVGFLGLLAAAGPVVTAIGALATIIGALVSPVGLVVAGIVALTAAFVQANGGIGPTIEKLKTLATALQEGIQPALQKLRDLWDAVWPHIHELTTRVVQDITEFVKPLIADMAAFFERQMGKIKAWVDENWPLIEQTIITVLTAIQTAWEAVWPYLEQVLGGVWEGIKILVSGALDVVLGLIKAAMQLINGDWEGAWETFKGVLTTIWETVVGLVENWLNTILGLFGTDLAKLGSDIAKFFTELPAKVDGWLSEMINAISGWANEMIDAGIQLIAGFIEGIKQKALDVANAAEDVVQAAINGVKNLLGIHSPSTVFAEIGLNTMLGLAEGLSEGQRAVLNELANIIQGIAAGITDMMAAITAASSWQPVESLTGQMENLMARVSELVGAVGTLSAIHRLDNVRPAAEWAQRVQEMVGLIRPAIESIIALTNMPAIRSLETQLDWFTGRLNEVVDWISALATSFEAEAIGRAVVFADAVGVVVGLIAPAVDALVALAEYDGATYSAAASQQMALNLSDTLENFVYLAGIWEQEAVDAAAAFADSARAVADLIRPAVDALIALATYDASTYSAAASQQFALNLSDTLENIVYIARLWEQEAVDAAATFAESASRVVSVVRPAVEALAALATYEVVMDLPTLILGFSTQLYQLVKALNVLSLGFKTEATQAAGTLYAAVQQVVGVVKPAVDALAALMLYEIVWDMPDRVHAFATQLYYLVTALNTLSLGFSVEATQSAATLYAAINSIVGVVKPGIDAVMALADYEPVQLLETQLDWFVTQLLTVVDWLQAAASDYETEGYTAAGAFYQAAGQIVAIVKPGIDALTALFDYRPVEELPATLARFTGQLFYLLDELNRLASGYEVEGYAAAAAFFQAASEIIGIVKPGVDALAALAEYKLVADLRGKFNNFAAQLSYVLQKLNTLAADYNVSVSEDAVLFYTSVEQLIKVLKPALDGLGQLFEYEGGDVKAKFGVFRTDLATLLTEMGKAAADLAGAGVSNAKLFQFACEDITDAFLIGLSALGTLESSTAGASAAAALHAFAEAAKTAMQAAAGHVQAGLDNILRTLTAYRSRIYEAGVALGQSLQAGLTAGSLSVPFTPPAPAPTGGATNVTNIYNLNANYAQTESEASLSDTVVMLQMATS
jgi:TP901 family phage tail tape measure protein